MTSIRTSAVTKEADYTGRCGNCHELLGENDKYCRYCGTERGKGKFEPYENDSYCVYGPPIKKKYKCTTCGHIWIVSRMGGDYSRYCPQCGKKTINTLENKMLDFSRGDVGLEEPYDIDEKPILFTEDEVLRLLEQRENKQIETEKTSYLTKDYVFDSLRRIGINIPTGADYRTYPRTEKEGEQIQLAYIILQTKGSDLYGNHGATCPCCGSSTPAAIEYSILGKRYEKLAGNVRATSSEDGLVFNDDRRIFYDDQRSRKIDYPAYICLRCATEYGKLEIPNDVIKAYEKQCERFGRDESFTDTHTNTRDSGMSVTESLSHHPSALTDTISTAASVIGSFGVSVPHDVTDTSTASTTSTSESFTVSDTSSVSTSESDTTTDSDMN